MGTKSRVGRDFFLKKGTPATPIPSQESNNGSSHHQLSVVDRLYCQQESDQKGQGWRLSGLSGWEMEYQLLSLPGEYNSHLYGLGVHPLFLLKWFDVAGGQIETSSYSKDTLRSLA